MGSIMVFGDICPDNNFRNLFDNGFPFSSEIVREIKEATIAIGNLECPATDNTTPIVKTGPNLRAKPEDLEYLSRVGFDVISLANNHIRDYGFIAVRDTIEKAHDIGLKTVGAGTNQADASQPLIMQCDDKSISIISFAEAEFNLATETTAGANPFDPYSSFDDVRKLKDKVDYLIVIYHGGIEHYKYPSPLLQKKCRKFADSGADVVLCQHSHCIGTIEEYNGSTILYGQGNSVFGYHEGDEAWNEGLIVSIDPSTREIELKLLQAGTDGVRYADDETTTKRLAQMEKDSKNLNDHAWIQSEWSKYCDSQKSLDLPLLYGWNRLFIKGNRVLKNKLIQIWYSRRKKRITMNLIRCEAHHEVIQTILENEIFH